MNEKQIVVLALKEEAKHKPKEKVFFGERVYTYEEFVEMLNRRKLKREERKIVQGFLKNAVKMFKENEAFRSKMMELAGVSP